MPDRAGLYLDPASVEPALPDAVFVEDTAVVLEEVAVITRPGVPSRRPETASVAAALAAHRPLHPILAPGTLDGGDVLRLGKQLYIGLSSRSNSAAIQQMADLLEPWGYTVCGVRVDSCLHLKSAVTQVADDLVLLNPNWVNPQLFDDFGAIEVDPNEPYAGNALLVGERVVYPTCYPATLERLAKAGLALWPLDMSELIKAEGAVTCCSILFG